MVADGQLLVRLDEADEEPLRGRAAERLVDRLAEAFAGHDAVLVSDYAAGTVGAGLVAALGRLQAAAPGVVVVDVEEVLAEALDVFTAELDG